jgi:hypothetical protein
LIPYHFDGQERVLEAPGGYDHEKDGECVGLPVRFERDGEGRIFAVSSMWKPTPEQLATLNAGGAVQLTCWGGQPPVMLDAVAGEILKVPA